MRVLVTGGLGFIGRRLVEALRAAGHQVFTFDVLHGPGPDHFRGDAADFNSFANAIRASDPEVVYHLAAEVGRHNGEHNTARLWATNAVGTKNLIRLQEARRFHTVFFSSSEVYGDSGDELREDAPLAGRFLNDYAATKWVGEQMVANSRAQLGTSTAVVRPFNVYGPGEPDSPYRGVVARFVHGILADRPVAVHEGHSRTFLYFDDLVAPLIRLADRAFAGRTFNLASVEPVGIGDLFQLVRTLVNPDYDKAVWHDRERLTSLTKRPCVEAARRELGFAPAVGLMEGLQRTIAEARRRP